MYILFLLNNTDQCFTCRAFLTFHCFRDLSNNHLTGEIPFNIGFLQVATLYVIVILFIERNAFDLIIASTDFKHVNYLYQIFAREQVLWSYTISDWPYAGACSAVS
jgi:hypothetical protein